MAPTRRRSNASSIEGDEPEMERSPKAHRLSNGSRASTGGSVASPAGDMDEEEEEEGNLDANEQLQATSATSSGNKGKGKRRHVSSTGDHSDGDEEEEEEEPEGGPEDFAAKSRKMAEICRQQDEEDRLRGREDSGGVEHAEGTPAAGKENEGPPLPKTKKGKKEKKDRNTAKKSEAGVVLKINVSNFMCHRKLTVPLCKQVNFINGRNGSGKSAILAALQICLGAKAHLTHRAKKMSDFIRHGWAGDAVLEVTLLNNEHGFKFEDYGESITVRRTIKQPTGGGFALVAHNGEIKSRDKGELARMLDTLNIQVDNPCAVLDQENSKKFLQGSERDKYAFFMKATDLDRILADCEQTGASISKMKAGHHLAVGMLPRQREIVKHLRAELNEYENIRVLKEKIDRLREKTVWAHVSETEEDVAILKQQMKENVVEIKKLEDKVEALEKEVAEIVAGKEEIMVRYDAGVKETERLKQEVLAAGKELAGAQQPLLDLRTQRVSLEGEKREKKAAKDAIARKVKLARDAARRSASDQREKALHETILKTEDVLANVEGMLEGRGGEERIFELRQAVSQAGVGAMKAREEYDSSQNELTALKTELRNLDAGAFNPLSAIANFMPGLVKYIQQEARQFSSLPVGPLGACIQLKEEHKDFRVCIEGHLMKNLHNFVVSCHQDKTKLMALMRRFRGNKHFPLPTIIVQSRQPRYRPQQNPPGLLQIMQAINVTDDQAFNSLVDQCSIEKTCLFASKEEAESRCLRGESGRYQRMPEGMFEAYYPSLGGKSCSKFSVSDGNIQTRMNTVNVRRHKSVLGVDAGTQKQEMQAQVQQTAARLEQDRAVAHEESRKAKAAEAALQQEEAERHRLGNEVQRLKVEKTRQSTQLLALQAKKSSAVDPTEELEKDLETATEELEGVVSDLATLEGHMREIAAQVEPFKVAKEAAKKAHKESSDATQRIHDEFEDGGQGETKKRQRISRIQAALAKGEEEQKTLSNDKAEHEAILQEKLEKAAVYMKNVRGNQGMEWDGQRVDTEGFTVLQLEHKVMAAKTRYEKERAKRNFRSKSKEEVENQLLQAFDVYKKKKDFAKRLAENMELLSSERKSRTTRWREMRDFVSFQTSRLFDEYLQDKGASGEVRFDNENHTLGLTYQKNSNDDASQCSDVKLLSGGERSFATLALLLALGQSHECPFRVMDEFDVFMDAMSRNIAIKQVVDFARKDSSRQFILITPQDLSSVTASDTCKIIKMKPPRKGDHNQATLEESFGAGAS